MTNFIGFINYFALPVSVFLFVAIPLLRWAKQEMWD